MFIARIAPDRKYHMALMSTTNKVWSKSHMQYFLLSSTYIDNNSVLFLYKSKVHDYNGKSVFLAKALTPKGYLLTQGSEKLWKLKITGRQKK